MRFKYDLARLGKKAHLSDGRGKTICQIENDGRPRQWRFSDEAPKGRELCENCATIAERNGQDLSEMRRAIEEQTGRRRQTRLL